MPVAGFNVSYRPLYVRWMYPVERRVEWSGRNIFFSIYWRLLLPKLLIKYVGKSHPVTSVTIVTQG